MISEQNLIKEIFGKDVKDSDVLLQCDLKTQELKYNQRSPRIKIMVLNIIKLLWKRNMFYIGDRLSESKYFIIESLISIYQHPLQAHSLEKNFEKIEKYGIVMTLLINSKLLFNEYFFHFFEIFLISGTIVKVLNTIFEKFGLYASFKFNIDVDELIEVINLSGCIEKGKCNYSKLNEFIYKKLNEQEEKKNDEKKEHNNKINQNHRNKKQKKQKHHNEKNIEKNDIPNIINKEININNNFVNYFKERKIFYNKKGLKTEILDEIINKNIKIDQNLFAYKKSREEWIIDPYSQILEKIISIFEENKNIEIINNKIIGYFCFKNSKNHIFEGIYSIIPLDLLFKEITDKMKFKPDKIDQANDAIENNIFKAKNLTFEYYINHLLINDFKFEELPRVFFYFKPHNTKDNDNSMIEINGAFYSNKTTIINCEKYYFIEDGILERNIEKNDFEYKNDGKNNITFEENSLNLIEIKSRNSFNDHEDKTNFENELLEFIHKSLIFYEMFKEKYQTIKKIKIILFYDIIKKSKYDKIISQIFEKFFENSEYKSFIDKIKLQCIFIPFPVFITKIQYLNEKIKFLEQLIIENETNIKDYRIENEKFKKENEILKNTIFNQKNEYEEKISNLKNDYEAKIINLKNEYESKLADLKKGNNTKVKKD